VWNVSGNTLKSTDKKYEMTFGTYNKCSGSFDKKISCVSEKKFFTNAQNNEKSRQ
jgi:hypothetical protein